VRVRVVPYSGTWPLRFEAESARLRAAVGSELVAIVHVGATAVPGLWARPEVDLLAVARDVRALGGVIATLAGLGYEPGAPARDGIRVGVCTEAATAVHLVGSSDPAVEGYLAVRAFLRAHPESVLHYGRHKHRLARRHPADPAAYAGAKAAFLVALERQAVRWYRRQARAASAAGARPG